MKRFILVALGALVVSGVVTRAAFADVTTGLVHRWTFDEASGSTAHDVVGGIDATLFNWSVGEPSWVPGMVGGAIDIRSDGNYVLTNSAVPNLNQFSISFWSKQTHPAGSNPRLITPLNELWIYQGQFDGLGIGFQTLHDTQGPMKQIWEHYTVTVDRVSSTATAYRNGVPYVSGAVNFTQPAAQWIFGHHQDPGNHVDPWNGMLDDVRVYDRVLSATEAMDLAARPVQPGLAATLVAPATNFGSQPTGEYAIRSASVTLDPAITNWVAWNRFADLRALAESRPGELFLGSHTPEVDDFFTLTVTNPLGQSLAINMDQNGSVGAPFGPQSVIFGASAMTPDVLRGDGFQSPFFFDEAGAHNSIFTVAGTYDFQFRFRNIGGPASFPDMYLLVSTVPEPESVRLILLGMTILAPAVWLRRQSRGV